MADVSNNLDVNDAQLFSISVYLLPSHTLRAKGSLLHLPLFGQPSSVTHSHSLSSNKLMLHLRCSPQCLSFLHCEPSSARVSPRPLGPQGFYVTTTETTEK